MIGVRRIHGFEFDRAVVEALPDLQFLHKSGTGTDWLDLPALTEHGILVATNDGFNAASVADHIVLLAQLCLRGTFEKLTQMRAASSTAIHRQRGAIGIDGKTVGIIGLGQIGTHAARRLAGPGRRSWPMAATRARSRPSRAASPGCRWTSSCASRTSWCRAYR